MKVKIKKLKRGCEITERDVRMLRFLWRWKAISTSALAAKFFPKGDPITAYCRLIILEKNGYIKSIDMKERRHSVWTLAERGFSFIKSNLLNLESYGYKSENYEHDHLASTFHIGEWLTNQPQFTQTYSEQELRRVIPDHWDDWVPRSTLHRPDGYSLYFEGENPVVVAFEIERSLKANARYESVVTFYDMQPSIKLVFWLVETRAAVNAIRRVFEKYNVRDWPKHHFVLISGFREQGWMAPFIEGKFKGKRPIDFLGTSSPSTGLLEPFCRRTHSLLDTKKKPIKSITSNPSSFQKNSD